MCSLKKIGQVLGVAVHTNPCYIWEVASHERPCYNMGGHFSDLQNLTLGGMGNYP